MNFRSFNVNLAESSFTTINGTGLVVWAVCGRLWRIDHHLGVAMVGGDEHGAAARTNRPYKSAQAGVHGFHGTARWAESCRSGRPYLRLAKLTITTQGGVIDGFDDGVGIPAADISGSDHTSRPSAREPARDLRRKWFFNPALKKYVTWAYFSVSATRRFA